MNIRELHEYPKLHGYPKFAKAPSRAKAFPDRATTAATLGNSCQKDINFNDYLEIVG